MGATGLAEAKFFAVITSALTFKKGHLDYYRRPEVYRRLTSQRGPRTKADGSPLV